MKQYNEMKTKTTQTYLVRPLQLEKTYEKS